MLSKYPKGIPIRTRVTDTAREVLTEQHNVSLVCTDTIQDLTDQYIEDNFDEVVKGLVDDTLYWEGRF